MSPEGRRYAFRSWQGRPVEGVGRAERSQADLIADARRARLFRQLADLSAPELGEVEAAIQRIKEARING